MWGDLLTSCGQGKDVEEEGHSKIGSQAAKEGYVCNFDFCPVLKTEYEGVDCCESDFGFWIQGSGHVKHA